MSLVAYGSSGESDNESDSEREFGDKEEKKSTVPPTPASVSVMTQSLPSSNAKKTRSEAPEVPPSLLKTNLHSKLPPPKTADKSLENVESEEGLELSSKLPAPKHHTTPSLLQSSLIAPQDFKNKGKKGTVKISIPALSDFPDDEEEPKTRKKIQPSAKGSGLFALLPAPKQAPVKEANRSLVPNVLTRKPATPAPVKKPLPKPQSQAVKRKQPDSDPDSDGEGDSIDFFSLNKEDKLPDIPMAEVGLEYQALGTSSALDVPSSSYQTEPTIVESQYQNYDQELQGNGIPQANSGQDFISFSNNADLELDDEAIKKLCGRKGRNREEIQIVDVSGDSIMPDQREWLTKQLTEEQPRSSSKSKLFGPSSQQKRKHQITYLAHIAKENELELKNQWANNRQTRKQTQSKYGF